MTDPHAVPPNYDNPCLSVRELVEILGVSERSVRNYIADGLLRPYGRIPTTGAMRFTWREVDRFLGRDTPAPVQDASPNAAAMNSSYASPDVTAGQETPLPSGSQPGLTLNGHPLPPPPEVAERKPVTYAPVGLAKDAYPSPKAGS